MYFVSRNFQGTKVYSFQNLNLGCILKISQILLTRFSNKVHSYANKSAVKSKRNGVVFGITVGEFEVTEFEYVWSNCTCSSQQYNHNTVLKYRYWKVSVQKFT